MAAKPCRERSRGRTPSPRRLQVEPSRDAEILTACRAAWDGPGATNAPAVHAMAAHTMSLMIAPCLRANSSRFGLTPTSYATGLPLALLQLQPPRIRTSTARQWRAARTASPPDLTRDGPARRDPPLPASRAMGPGRAHRRNGALAARDPQMVTRQCNNHEHPSSYSYIRLTGGSDA